MQKRTVVYVLCVISILLCSGCNFDFFKPKDKPTTKPPKTDPVTAKINGPLLARVNDWAIGLEDFNRILKQVDTSKLSEDDKAKLSTYEGKRAFLDNLIRTAYLVQEAKRRGLDKGDDVVEAFNAILVERLLQDIIQTMIVSEGDIQGFYDKNKESLQSAPQLRIREIATNDMDTAKAVQIKLLQGESFKAVAEQFSVLPSKNKGGDLGLIKLTAEEINKHSDKYWEKVLPLEKGEISNVFQDGGKYYILKLEEKIASQALPLSEIREEIVNAIKSQKLQDFMESIRKKSVPEIKDDLLR